MTQGKSQKTILPSLLLGVFFILAGIALFLHQMGFIYLGDALHYWPLVAVIPLGVERLWNRGFLKSFFGHLLILFGVFSQMVCLDMEPLIQQWWPVGILWLGFVVTLKALYGRAKGAPGTLRDCVGERRFP